MKLAVQFILLVLMCACGTRHKQSNSETVKSKFRFEIDTNYSFKRGIDFKKALRSYQAAQFQNLNIQYKGKPGDSISIQQYGADGKLLQETRIKGTGEANLNQSSGTSQEQTTTKESGHSEEEGKAAGHKQALGENSIATNNLDKSTWSFPWWLWLILIVVAAAALSRFSKSFLPWPFNIKTDKNEG